MEHSNIGRDGTSVAHSFASYRASKPMSYKGVPFVFQVKIIFDSEKRVSINMIGSDNSQLSVALGMFQVIASASINNMHHY